MNPSCLRLTESPFHRVTVSPHHRLTESPPHRYSGSPVIRIARDPVIPDSPVDHAHLADLRYAWTTDIVIDFVGTHLAATAHGSPPLQNCGAMLVYAAVRIGAICGAPLVYAETARHSVAWWDKLLEAGERLIKVATVPAAAARLIKIIAIQGEIIIKET